MKGQGRDVPGRSGVCPSVNLRRFGCGKNDPGDPRAVAQSPHVNSTTWTGQRPVLPCGIYRDA